MRIYTVHTAPPAIDADGQPALIREGFNPWAFLFGVFWALYRRCWRAAAGIAMAEAGLVALAWLTGAGPEIRVIAQIGLSLFIGYHANDWRRSDLARAGWRFDSIVAAANAESALIRWRDNGPAGQTPRGDFAPGSPA